MILLNSNEFATRLSAFFSWKCVSHLSREYHLSEIGSVRRGARENEQEERRQRLKRLKKNYSFLYTTTYFKKVVFRETHEKSILKVATISRLLTASRYLRNYNDPKFSWILIAFNGVLTCVERYLLYRKVLLNIEDYLNWFKSYPQVIPHSRWIEWIELDRKIRVRAKVTRAKRSAGSYRKTEKGPPFLLTPVC